MCVNTIIIKVYWPDGSRNELEGVIIKYACKALRVYSRMCTPANVFSWELERCNEQNQCESHNGEINQEEKLPTS